MEVRIHGWHDGRRSRWLVGAGFLAERRRQRITHSAAMGWAIRRFLDASTGQRLYYNAGLRKSRNNALLGVHAWVVFKRRATDWKASAKQTENSRAIFTRLRDGEWPGEE